VDYVEIETKKIDDKFSRGVSISLALHAMFISFFVLKAAFFDSPAIDFSQAIRVDVVGLPSKLDIKAALLKKPESKNSPATAKNISEPKHQENTAKAELKVSKNNDGIKLEKSKNQQQNAFEKLKSMAALEKIQEDVDKEKIKQLQGNGKASAANPKIRGNVLSPGSSLTGLAKLQHETYASELDRHIKERWALPEWLANRDLKAQVKVFFDEHGNIIRRKIVKSSGNPNYDEEVLATIDRSAPFPSPPEKFVSIVETDGILIGFPE
jgi:colicin import membrane protein